MTATQFTFSITAAGAYLGPGDFVTYKAWYGVRAMSAAARGRALMHVHKNTPMAAGPIIMGMGDGIKTVFSLTTALLPIKIGSVLISTIIGGKTLKSYDRFNGITRIDPVVATTGVGAVNYSLGTISITYSVPPDAAAAVQLEFQYTPDGQGDADVFSDPVTGDLVPVVIGGVTCPDTLGTFTVSAVYDQTGNGHGVVQPVINKRPLLMLRAVPLLGTERRVGIWYQDASVAPNPIPTLGGSAALAWGPAPMTMSLFLINQNPTPSRLGNTVTNSVPLRPASGKPFIGFQTSGGDSSSDRMLVSAGTNGWAPSVVNGSIGAFQISPQPYILDHEPHAIQVMFAADGITSRAYVDGFLYPNLATGTTIPASDTIELGASDLPNHFNGVLFEAGIAAGDQSAHNAAVDANQRAYYTTPAPHTPVFAWTVDFNKAVPGTRVTWNEQVALFNDPSVSLQAGGYPRNTNYVETANPTTTTCTYEGPTVTPTCEPAPVALFRIVRDGPASTPTIADPAMEITYPKGEYGYPMPGIGHMDMFFNFNTISVPETSYDGIELEYDMMLRDAATAPNGLDFNLYSMLKTGMYAVFYPTIGGNTTDIQPMLYTVISNDGKNTPLLDVNGKPYAYMYNNCGGEGGADGAADFIGIGGPMGLVHLGVWYHHKMQVFLGPNGFMKFYHNDGPGTPLRLGHALSRHDPWRFAAALNTWAGALSAPDFVTARKYYKFTSFGIGPHFGGGVADQVQHDSYIVYDNITLRGYKR